MSPRRRVDPHRCVLGAHIEQPRRHWSVRSVIAAALHRGAR